jgi:hypothetical protein
VSIPHQKNVLISNKIAAIQYLRALIILDFETVSDSVVFFVFHFIHVIYQKS